MAHATHVTKTDYFGGHGHCHEGYADADGDVVYGVHDDGTGLQQLQQREQEMHEVAFGRGKSMAQALLHHQREGDGGEHRSDRAARRPLLDGADQRRHHRKVHQIAVFLKVAHAYAQRHKKQAADAEVEPAAVQVNLRHGNTLRLRLSQGGNRLRGAEADDGGPRLELG